MSICRSDDKDLKSYFFLGARLSLPAGLWLKSRASNVNAGLTLLYWHVGFRIRREILKNERAEYGQKIVATLWRQLTAGYGKGFMLQNTLQSCHPKQFFAIN